MGSFSERAIGLLFGLPATTVYLMMVVLCWAEAAFFLGFVTPGELAIAAGGILASRGQVSVGWLMAVIVLGTMAGNATGYVLGRRWGAGMLAWPPLHRFLGSSIDRTRDFMARRGEWAIVLGRLTTPTRIVVPFLTGASEVPYRRYLLFDLPATMVWAVAWVSIGMLLGESWDVLQEVAGTAALLVLILFVAALVIRWITARIAANQRRAQATFDLVLRVTGTRGMARALGRGLDWLGRRFDPRLAHGLSLTVAFLALITAVGVAGIVVNHTQEVRGLVLLDFPVLEWMGETRTDEAVQISRSGLRLFHWPGVLFLALPLMLLLGWKRGAPAALRIGVGLVGAGAGAYILDRFVVQGVVPGAEFPSVPVAVSAALLVHTTATAARGWGWGPSVTTAGVGTFVLCTVALGTVVAGWAAPSGIALGFAMGMGWATALELPRTLQSAELDAAAAAPVVAIEPQGSSGSA